MPCELGIWYCSPVGTNFNNTANAQLAHNTIPVCSLRHRLQDCILQRLYKGRMVWLPVSDQMFLHGGKLPREQSKHMVPSIPRSQTPSPPPSLSPPSPPSGSKLNLLELWLPGRTNNGFQSTWQHDQHYINPHTVSIQWTLTMCLPKH